MECRYCGEKVCPAGGGDRTAHELYELRQRLMALEADASTVAHLRSVSAKVAEGMGAGAHLSHAEVAGRIRMATRSDLDFEMVCVMARDRIIGLANQVQVLREELAEAQKDGERWRGLLAKYAIRDISEAIGLYEELAEKYGVDHPELASLRDVMTQVRAAIDAAGRATVKKSLTVDAEPSDWPECEAQTGHKETCAKVQCCQADAATCRAACTCRGGDHA